MLYYVNISKKRFGLDWIIPWCQGRKGHRRNA